MNRVLPAAVLLAAVGCSNAPIAGSLDAIWPARAADPPPAGEKGPPLPIVPDVRPPSPDVPRPPVGPAATDSLPPPADIVPKL
ncbi:hypothetical protein J0H58_09025 [bacterium]|nr:hypothetical protein [bacterium]